MSVTKDKKQYAESLLFVYCRASGMSVKDIAERLAKIDDGNPYKEALIAEFISAFSDDEAKQFIEIIS